MRSTILGLVLTLTTASAHALSPCQNPAGLSFIGMGEMALLVCMAKGGDRTYHSNGKVASDIGGERAYHANGKLAKDIDGSWFHSNGRLAYEASSGDWYHSNGTRAYHAIHSSWYHANGKSAGTF